MDRGWYIKIRVADKRDVQMDIQMGIYMETIIRTLAAIWSMSFLA